MPDIRQYFAGYDRWFSKHVEGPIVSYRKRKRGRPGPEEKKERDVASEINLGETEVEATPQYKTWQPEGSPVRIEYAVATLQRIARHAEEGLPHEVIGLLVGSHKNVDGVLEVNITGMIPAKKATGDEVSVRITPEVWEQLLNDYHTKYGRMEDRSMVGWYHSHPNMAIFLSPPDRSTHRDKFKEPWHVALVVNPGQGDQAGFFVWEGDDIPSDTPEAYKGSLRAMCQPARYPGREARDGEARPGLLQRVGVRVLFRRRPRLEPEVEVRSPAPAVEGEVLSLVDLSAERSELVPAAEEPIRIYIPRGTRRVYRPSRDNPLVWALVAMVLYVYAFVLWGPPDEIGYYLMCGSPLVFAGVAGVIWLCGLVRSRRPEIIRHLLVTAVFILVSTVVGLLVVFRGNVADVFSNIYGFFVPRSIRQGDHSGLNNNPSKPLPNPNSNSSNETAKSQLPAPVLKKVGQQSEKVDFSWRPPDTVQDRIKGYKVYRKIPGKDYVEEYNVDKRDGCHYIDYGPPGQRGVKFQYAVAAIDQEDHIGKRSKWSEPIRYPKRR